MRIGVDGRELRTDARTGIGRYVLEVLRAASGDGWESVVYGDRRTGLDVALPGVTLRILDASWTQWWDQVALPRRLVRDGVSAFLSPYYKGPLLAPCPVVLTIHDLFFLDYPGRHRPVYRAVMTRVARLYARRATAIIADSEYSRRSIAERLGVSQARVSAIPVALGAEFKPTPLGEAVRARYALFPPYILYVGNFRPHKNLPRLIRAYAALPHGLRTGYGLVLAGGDRRHLPSLVELARGLGVADRVLFPGLIDDRDLPALYSGCALFVLPSLEEGFGLPALEAMACGAPVAVANRAAIPEVVGPAALLFDPEDETAITEAITRVLSRVELREDLRSRSLVRAREFTPERTSRSVLALLRRVSQER